MGELGALFNPGMRHELEERQAKAARREEEGNAKDGDLRIDLESGVAVINAPGEGAAEGRSVERGAVRQKTPAHHPAEHDSAERAAVDRDAVGDGADNEPTATSPVEQMSPTEPATHKPAAASAGVKTTAKRQQAADAIRPRGKRGASAAR